ncbi:Nn.00g083870.m01.CDS01 [Neocucurbitaria sp. VM-36]
MTTTNDDATNVQPKYRPFRRDRNEIRLLRILPPLSSIAADTLELSTEVVRCEMQHYSLDDFVKPRDNPVPGSSSTNEAQQAMRIQPAESILAGISKSPERFALLSHLYKSQVARFKRLLLRNNWDSDNALTLLVTWLKSWIWTPLAAGEGGDDDKLKLYRIFQNMSPTCASLLEEAIPAIADIPKSIERRTKIFLNDQQIFIGNNLASALQALSEVPEVQAGTLVWVDALCINQNDLKERTIEVKRMDVVYGNATRVISWLSEADQRHVEALEFMNMVGGFLGQLDASSPWFDTFDLHEMLEYQAVLSELSYWYRAWIVQEIVLAAPSSQVICCDRYFYWENILNFAFHFSSRRFDSQSILRLFYKDDRPDKEYLPGFAKFNVHMACLRDVVVMRRLGDQAVPSKTPTEA